MGSWATTAPAAYSAYAGLLGLATYAVSCGAPIVVVAYAGGAAQALHPSASSLPEFLSWRFRSEGTPHAGHFIAALVAALNLFNMSVALLAEYVSLGTLFRVFVGVEDYAVAPVLGMALLTMAYTATGGLYVSILTDRVQAVVTVALVAALSVHLAAEFRPGALPELTSEQAGISHAGAAGPSHRERTVQYPSSFWESIF
jgi:Na+/proline symporter